MAALGVLVGLRTPEPAFRFAGPPAPELQWRWIITDAFEGPRTADHLVAPCANEGATFETKYATMNIMCSCKMAWWYVPALLAAARLKARIVHNRCPFPAVGS